MYPLFFLTNFGDPFLTIPLAAVVLCWLACASRPRAACSWALGFGCGASLVALSKFAYAAWDIGSTTLHFTGISGHTMLSTAVYPPVAAICASRAGPVAARYAIYAGFIFAVSIGLSRVAIGAHSWSEVVSGCVLGGAIAVMTLRVAASTPRLAAHALPQNHSNTYRTNAAKRGTAAFVTAALTIVLLGHGHIAPVSSWITDVAPKLTEWWSTL